MKSSAPLLAAVLSLLASCSAAPASSGEIQACDLNAPASLTPIIGQARAESFELTPLSECVWTSDDGVVTVRVETVPDADLFVEHSIESTNAARVSRLDGELAGGVLFENEAIVVPIDDMVIMVDGSVPTADLLAIAVEARDVLVNFMQ